MRLRSSASTLASARSAGPRGRAPGGREGALATQHRSSILEPVPPALAVKATGKPRAARGLASSAARAAFIGQCAASDPLEPAIRLQLRRCSMPRLTADQQPSVPTILGRRVRGERINCMPPCRGHRLRPRTGSYNRSGSPWPHKPAPWTRSTCPQVSAPRSQAVGWRTTSIERVASRALPQQARARDFGPYQAFALARLVRKVWRQRKH
jgi:hypothetical protein